MRAVVLREFGGPEVLRLEQADRPEPSPTEVLVRVRAAGVNPVDAKTRAGRGMAAVLGEPPLIVGWDVAGVVEEVGAGVTRFVPGDEVFGMPWFPRQAGAYSEYVTAPSRHFAPLPHGLTVAQAAALPLAGLTAWQALVDLACITDGDRVLVHAAAGGVGHLAVQVAKARGAYVLGTARGANHDFLHELGVDEPIDYSERRFEQVAGDLDVVLDLVGTEEYGLRSLEALREGGLLIAVPSGTNEKVVSAARAAKRRVSGILVEPDLGGLQELAGLVAACRLTVEVAGEYELGEAAAAHEAIESGRTRGKLVLIVG